MHDSYYEYEDLVGGNDNHYSFGGGLLGGVLIGIAMTMMAFMLLAPDTPQCDNRKEYSWLYVQTLDKYIFQRTIIYCDEFDARGNPKVKKQYYAGGYWDINLSDAYFDELLSLKEFMWRRGFVGNYKIDTLQ